MLNSTNERFLQEKIILTPQIQIENQFTNQQIALPQTYIYLLVNFPELYPLLTAFCERDQATFLHSVAVHFAATRLAHDLSLYFSNYSPNKNDTRKQRAQQQQQQQQQKQKIAENWLNQMKTLAPFWILHDIGKTASSLDIQDYSIAQNIVHPIHGQKRSSYYAGMHYIHPQQSGHLISTWAKLRTYPSTTSKFRSLAYKWAKLSYMHDKRVNIFLPYDIATLPLLEHQALLLFSASDTSVAMGLPRPNKQEIASPSKIKGVLFEDHLTHATLKRVFPHFNSNNLREFIFASISHSLQILASQFPNTLLTSQNMQPDLEKTMILDQIIVKAWKTYEKNWDNTLLKMDQAKVL